MQHASRTYKVVTTALAVSLLFGLFMSITNYTRSQSLIDSPIPPGFQPRPYPKIEVTKDTGYCVMPMVGGEPLLIHGTALRVQVPLHKPASTPEGIEELRASIFSALFQAAQHAESASILEADPKERGKLRQQAQRLTRKLSHGVRFSWEPEPVTDFFSAPKCLDCGGAVCTCATYYGSDVVVGGACQGGCGNCWSCK